MKLIFSYTPVPEGTWLTNEVRYFVCPKTVILDREMQITTPTQVGFAIDHARTVGCDEVVFPFSTEIEQDIAKRVAKAYSLLGLEMKISFPVRGNRVRRQKN